MPKFDMTTDDAEFTIPGIGAFKFSGKRVSALGDGADEYTLVTIALDVSGSTHYFSDDMLKMLKEIISTCKNHPTSEKIMVRVISFNDVLEEIHGFKEINEIDVNDYQSLNPRGLTALYDAIYSSVGATITYGETLINQSFDANGDVYIITDGYDNRSIMTPSEIKKQIDSAIQDEKIESIRTFLIGLVNPSNGNNQYLIDFKDQANITEYINIGDANENSLAKLANYISKSISMQSQSLGTGGPSQTLTF